jgi:YCII-related domain
MRYLILISPTDPADDPAKASYHEELVTAGVLLAGDLSAGFWLLEVGSPAEAAEWGRRLPCADGDFEIREVTR